MAWYRPNILSRITPLQGNYAAVSRITIVGRLLQTKLHQVDDMSLPERTAIVRRKWTRHLSVLTIGLATNLAGCFLPKSVALPTRGRVYLEREHDGAKVLEPAPGVLVLASRLDVCDRRPWMLAEASSTGIDAFLVRSDERGYFTIPARTERVCSRAILLSTAFVPGFYSLSGRVALTSTPAANKEAYSSLREGDAVLQPREPTAERAEELASELYSSFSSYTVTTEMREAILREMHPEIVQLMAKSPGAWERECKRLGLCS